jgi:hypothetical protein
VKLEDAQHEMRTALDEYFRRRNLVPEERLTTLSVIPKVDQHLSIGLAPQERGEFGVEVRIRREHGYAARYAEDLERRLGRAVSISRLTRAEIPSNARTQQAASSGVVFGDHRRPLWLGASIGHRDAMAGSLGLFVEFTEGPTRGQKGILSNSHVLALCGRGRAGDPIFQPGKPDARPLRHSLKVGALVDFTMLSPVGSQDLDVATAVLDNENLIDEPNVIPQNLAGCAHCGRPIAGLIEPEELTRSSILGKVGRTTGWTTGKVTAFGLDNLPIFVPQLGRNLRFDNMVEISWSSPTEVFSGPGDSGSVVYDTATMAAVGLIVAGGVLERDGKPVGVSYACSLSRALQIFGLKMLS